MRFLYFLPILEFYQVFEVKKKTQGVGVLLGLGLVLCLGLGVVLGLGLGVVLG